MTDAGHAGLAAKLAAALDPGGARPLSSQIVDRVWLDVIEGTIQTGARMPTVRELAVQLGVTPTTVERAYEQLEQLGIVSTRSGEGTFVQLNVPDNDARKRRQEFEQCCLDAVARAESLGFSVADILETLDDIRAATRNDDVNRRGT